MRLPRILPIMFLLLPALFSCDKTLQVNADWKDVTVVYGILDQTEDTTFIKVTKAFLGEGDALQFARIADSSTYPDKLLVRLDVYRGARLLDSIVCDTITIRNKRAGDSIFYFPDQLMYYTTRKLDTLFTYKLNIINRETGKEVTSQTSLLQSFAVYFPQVTASFLPGKPFRVKWDPSRNGKRYQLVIRFFYLEALKSNTDSLYMRSFDWMLFNNVRPLDVSSTQPFDLYFPGDLFYNQVNSHVPFNPNVTRVAHHCDFIFTVGASDLNTYMEVTEPSLSLIQEKPSYTNIVNGIGIFSARFMQAADSLFISQFTKDELKVNPLTSDLGF